MNHYELVHTISEKEVKASLEGMLDRFGMEGTLNLLSDICHEKADHLRENWQDEGMAYEWDKRGKELSKEAQRKSYII